MTNKKQMKKVSTISGEECFLNQVKRFKEGYYKIGDKFIENSGDCYLLDDGKYYRMDTGLICYDHFTKQYVLKNNKYMEKSAKT